MKRELIVISGLILSSLLLKAQPSGVKTNLKPEDQHPMVGQLVMQVLGSQHYQPPQVNDGFSEKVYDNYLKDLDYYHSYFWESDVAEFAPLRNQIDDKLPKGEVEFIFNMYNRYLQRLDERIRYTYKLLDGDSLNFSANDSFQVKREHAPWCKNKEELDELWSRKIKYELVSLKAGGKNWKEATDVVRKRYENLEKFLSKTQSEDIFSVFMNSLSETIDPHTNYFSPKQGDDFRINTSQALEGIGATLQTENDYTKIAALVKGGPAEHSKKLKVGDKIVTVGQGVDGEMIDIVGWRIDDVVGKIRGPKGTVVRLGVISADESMNAKPHIIQLQRDKIKIEEQTAKGEIQEVIRDNKKYKIGVITLPAFYFDYQGQQKGETDFSSSTRDVRKLIEGFKKQSIAGVVLDLRNNGGGSLLEAINLSGLFIPYGPMVQVKYTDGNVKVEQDFNPDVAWDGPLTVLINRFSASASEILAGAIQDYNRGLILGEKSFGKGTVQNVTSLDQYVRVPDKRLGELKITTAKFYRVNGSSTQLKGVSPDINFPSLYDDKEYGEEGYDYPMPWDQIATSDFKATNDVNKAEMKLMLKKKHDERMRKNEEYSYLLDDVIRVRNLRDQEYSTINLERYKKEQDEQAAKNKIREEARKKLANPKEGTEVKYDLILEEGEQILVDLIQMSGDKFAQTIKK